VTRSALPFPKLRRNQQRNNSQSFKHKDTKAHRTAHVFAINLKFSSCLRESSAAVHRTAVVRLGAHLNSGVRVPDLADTVGPVTESNCAGPYRHIPEWRATESEQPVRNDWLRGEAESELNSDGDDGEPATEVAKPEQNSSFWRGGSG